MSIRFRKSIKLGPFRINLSSKGIGTSVGVKGLRTGVRADGSRYTNVSLPGTGISSQINHEKSRNTDSTPEPAEAPSSGSGGFFLLLMVLAILLLIGIFRVR